MHAAKTSLEKVNQVRDNIPALKNKSYFNYGALGVLSNQVLNEIDSTYRYVQENGPFGPSMLKWMFDQIRQSRHAFATKFGTGPDDFALTSSVTDGCNIVLWGLDWQPGDHLITTDHEHYGVVGTVAQIANRKQLQVSKIEVHDGLSDDQILSSFEKAMTPRTKLVVISHVLWNTGRILPADEIGRICRKHSVRYLIDGAQSAGVLPLSLDQLNCDYYAITAHKWLCAPEGMAALYVKPGMTEEVAPTFVGWRGVKLDEEGNLIGWEKGAPRYEVATVPFPLMPALRAALKMHDDFGPVDERYELICRQVQRLKEALTRLSNVELISGFEHKSSLVSFKVTSVDQNTAVKELEKRKVLLRTIPSPEALRASVHYFTTDSEIDALIDGIRNLKQGAAGGPSFNEVDLH